MATNSATYVGTSGVVKFDVSGTPTAVGSVRTFSVSQVTDTIETSVMGSQDKTFLPGQTSFTGTADVLFRDDDSSQTTILAAIGAAPATIELYPSGDTTGIKLSGEVIITGHDISVDQNDAVSASITFQGTGALTRTNL